MCVDPPLLGHVYSSDFQADQFHYNLIRCRICFKFFGKDISHLPTEITRIIEYLILIPDRKHSVWLTIGSLFFSRHNNFRSKH